MVDNAQPTKNDIPIEFQFRLRELVTKLNDYHNMFDTMEENNQANMGDKGKFIEACNPLRMYVYDLDHRQNET